MLCSLKVLAQFITKSKSSFQTSIKAIKLDYFDEFVSKNVTV